MKQSPKIRQTAICLVLLLLIPTLLGGCVSTDPPTEPSITLHSLRIQNNRPLTLEIGDTVQLCTDAPEELLDELEWTSSSGCVGVTQTGTIIAQACGQATVRVTYGLIFDSITVTVVTELPKDTESLEDQRPDGTSPDSDSETELPPPTVIVEAERSPEGYEPAGSYEEALERSQKGKLSGYPYVPDQAPVISEYRPTEDGMYIKNTAEYFMDDNTYVVVDAYGREVFRIYRGGAYITLEEVAAYVWAFGDIPANHSASKSAKPTASIWGEYLRVNHSKFSGNTAKYPYEPVLPRISGCGGDFTYYEMDIGTTGTDCDPSYTAAFYNNGYSITRGAARIVYARFDRNGNKIIDPDEKYVFYTYNHYNDFREYLNYYGGWGEMFGNITGGGSISSKYDYNPTDYVPVATAPITARHARVLPVLYAEPPTAPVRMEATLMHCNLRRFRDLAA